VMVALGLQGPVGSCLFLVRAADGSRQAVTLNSR